MTPDTTIFAIETEGLCKVFGSQVAVQDLTLQVRQGEVFGFLGPNGAGKTTSIKMLLGLIAPTEGQARLLGVPLADKQGSKGVRGRVGFLPEHFRFYEWLTAGEFLTLHGELYGMAADRLRRQIAELLDRVGLGPFRNQQLRTYSKGMLQRVGLAQALLNQPDLVFLDEPTSGLDPVGRRIVLAALLLGVGFLIVFSLGFRMITGQSIQLGGADSSQLVQTESYNFLLLAGLYAITFLLIALGALLAADSLAGEISSGTVQTVVTKPLDRFQVVLGKWFGFAGLLGLYLVLMAGGVIISVWLQSRYLAPHLLAGLGLIYLESLLIMSVSLMCSSRLSALATGAVVFGMYGLALLGVGSNRLARFCIILQQCILES